MSTSRNLDEFLATVTAYVRTHGRDSLTHVNYPKQLCFGFSCESGEVLTNASQIRGAASKFFAGRSQELSRNRAAEEGLKAAGVEAPVVVFSRGGDEIPRDLVASYYKWRLLEAIAQGESLRASDGAESSN